MAVMLVLGAKRRLGLKRCLQLGGYASSYDGCITTSRLIGLKFEL